MKKRARIAVITMIVALVSTSITTFAGTADGYQNNGLSVTDELASEQFMSEKIDEAVEVLQEKQPQLPVGKEYVAYEYNLSGSCSVEVELQDKEENLSGGGGIRLMATSGSSSVWKGYGNRYFTATAKVKCGTKSVTFSLENHYTLSAKGITERYGTAKVDGSTAVTLTKGNPVISKSTAGSVGSKTSIYCNFSCRAATTATQKYKLNTSVKYLSIDKTGKRLNVQQSWGLTKI